MLVWVGRPKQRFRRAEPTVMSWNVIQCHCFRWRQCRNCIWKSPGVYLQLLSKIMQLFMRLNFSVQLSASPEIHFWQRAQQIIYNLKVRSDALLWLISPELGGVEHIRSTVEWILLEIIAWPIPKNSLNASLSWKAKAKDSGEASRGSWVEMRSNVTVSGVGSAVTAFETIQTCICNFFRKLCKSSCASISLYSYQQVQKFTFGNAHNKLTITWNSDLMLYSD